MVDIVNMVLYFVYDGYCNYGQLFVYGGFLYGENATHCISISLINGLAMKKIDSKKVVYLKCWFPKSLIQKMLLLISNVGSPKG